MSQHITDIQKAQDVLKDAIKESSSIVFFGGAGVSTASGIPDFRSKDGLYNRPNKYKYDQETMLSSKFFYKHTKEFYEFYKELSFSHAAKPNNVHKALAKLEQDGKLLSVVTQNIDGLHQEAGTKRIHELHGSILSNTCIECHNKFDASYVKNSVGIPTCDTCGGVIKPDVVLYGEPLDESVITSAIEDILRADLLLVGGTSLTVYPAAGLLKFFKGDKLILINRDPTPLDMQADVLMQVDINQLFKPLL